MRRHRHTTRGSVPRTALGERGAPIRVDGGASSGPHSPRLVPRPAPPRRRITHDTHRPAASDARRPFALAPRPRRSWRAAARRQRGRRGTDDRRVSAQKQKAWGTCASVRRPSRRSSSRGSPPISRSARRSFRTQLAKINAKATKAAIACRYGDNGDGTVTDYDTGLQWEQKDGEVGGSACILVDGRQPLRERHLRVERRQAFRERLTCEHRRHDRHELPSRLCRLAAANDRGVADDPGCYRTGVRQWMLPASIRSSGRRSPASIGRPLPTPRIRSTRGSWTSTVGIVGHDFKVNFGYVRAVRAGL